MITDADVAPTLKALLAKARIPGPLLREYREEPQSERTDTDADAAAKLDRIVRAVLDKHPMVHLDGKFICHGCTHLLCEDERPVSWPCPTVQAIIDALEAG